jgi:hypothetical protein
MDSLIDDLASQLCLSREEARERLKKCEVIPFFRNGKVTMYFVLLGNEIHIWSHPEFRGRCLLRHGFADFLRHLLDEYGFLTTRIPIDTPARDRTGERVGFKWTWRDDRFDYYILTQPPFRGKRTEPEEKE